MNEKQHPTARAYDALRRHGVKRALAVLTRPLRLPATESALKPTPALTYPPLHKGDLPTISILMPVYNSPPDVLVAAIQSVLRQDYPHWELCIADDCSPSRATQRVLERYRGFDPRIKIVRSPQNLHIAGATNLAAEYATGNFVGFLDHDDELVPHALTEMAQAIMATPDVDLLYSDEDKLDFSGQRTDPYLKPDWSPEHLTSVAYILHFMLVRKSLFLELGGLRAERSGAQDYDLSLRAGALARKIVHVPKVLYHWRMIPGSASAEVEAKPEALINAAKAIEDFVRLENKDARVVPGLFTGSHRVLWPVSQERPVTLLMLTDSRSKFVPGRGHILMVEHAIQSIVSKSTFKNYKIIVVDNGRMDQDAKSRMETLGVKVVNYTFTPPFNYATKLNFGFNIVETEDVIILNDDIEVISEDWIEALLAHSRREDVGGVGAKLLYTDGKIQHAGVVTGVNGATTHIFQGWPDDQIGYCGYTHVVRNYSAVTGAVLATRMSIVKAMGGFDTRLAIDYNDIDFCLRVGETGRRIVFTPYARLYHFEGASLKRSAVSEADQTAFMARWARQLPTDPFYNPTLPKDRTDCAVYAW